MRQTENFALNLPEGQDNYDKDDYNENFEIIDEKLKYLADHISGGGVLEEKTIFSNGIYTPPEGVDGWNKIIAAVTPALMNRTITENGTYTASQEEPVSYDGYGTLIVNVQPTKVLISEFDFTDVNAGDMWKRDKVKQATMAVSAYTNISHTENVGIYITGTSGSFDTHNRLNRFGVYEIDMEFGTNTTETFNSYNTIFNFLRSGAHFAVRWNTSQNKWQVSDATSNTKWIENNDPHYFDGKKVKVTYGCRYIDGVLTVDGYRNTMSIYLINDDDSLTELCYSNENYDEVFLKLGGGNSYVGFVYKNIKVYQYFDKYETPVSLMSMASQSEELMVEVPIEESEEK